MAESTEKENSWLWDFFKEIKNRISGLWNDVLRSINDICWKEVFKVINKTQENLNNLADDILSLKSDELSDKKINEKEKNILKQLMWNEKIKKYFERLNDSSIWDELLNSEKEGLLQTVINVSNNDSNKKKSDLTETEMNNIVSDYESKLNILNSVLDDENIKNKDPKVTKKQVLDIYNSLSSDKRTKENIIKELNGTTGGFTDEKSTES